MTAIEAPQPADGTEPTSGDAVLDADQPHLPIPAPNPAAAGADAGIAGTVGNPALDIAERLLALQFGNAAQRDLSQFILRAIQIAENADPTQPAEDEEGLRDDKCGEDGEDGDNAVDEEVSAPVLAYRAGIAGVDAYETLASALEAGRARVMTHTYAHAGAAIASDDVTPGELVQHADGTASEVMTHGQIAAIDLATVLHAPFGLVRRQITTSAQLVHYMPHTLGRLESGELTAHHWRMISNALAGLNPSQMQQVDDIVSARSFVGTGQHVGIGQDRATTSTVRRRLDKALAAIGWEPPSTTKRKDGFRARYIGFGPAGDDGMAPVQGLIPALHARAISMTLTDLANTAPEGDERTLDQRRVDGFLTLFTGPAALAPPVQAELDLEAVSFDDDGQYTVVDAPQNLIASEIWATIRLLAATLGLTFPDVPKTVINLDITTETLDRAMTAAAVSSAPPPGAAPPDTAPPCTVGQKLCAPPGDSTDADRPEHGSVGEVCPQSAAPACPIHDLPHGDAQRRDDPHSPCTGLRTPVSFGVSMPATRAVDERVEDIDGAHDRRPPRAARAETQQDNHVRDHVPDTTQDADTTTDATVAVRHAVSDAHLSSTSDATDAEADLGADDVRPVLDFAAEAEAEESSRLRAATVRGLGDIPDSLALRLLQHADLRRILTDPVTGQPVEVGRRRPNTALRNAVLNRDRTCRFPGCERSPASMDLDHVVPYDDATRPTDGQTTPENLQALCRLHHRAKHQMHWSPVMNEDSSITWRNNLLQIITTT